MKENENKGGELGLALSGGGYRAATYHIGTFRALKKLNLLHRINTISSNSGGSITAACYALYGSDYAKFEERVLKGVRKGIVGRVLISVRFLLGVLIIILPIINAFYSFFNLPNWLNILILVLAILLVGFAQFYMLPLSSIIEKKYIKIFFGKKTLKDFSNNWKTILNSTNLETGRLFTFESNRMLDTAYNDYDKKIFVKFNHEDFPVARAVMASTSVPFAFTPVKIKKKFYVNPTDTIKTNPRLVDGGVYDNQGIHKLTQRNSSCYCHNVIVSDAGQGFPFKNTYRNSFALLIRTSSVFMERIKNLQMINSLYRGMDNNSIVAYQSLGFNIEDSVNEFIKMLRDGNISKVVTDAHGITPEQITSCNWDDIETLVKQNISYNDIIKNACSEDDLEIARSVKTGLSRLKQSKIDKLIKHAEVITELQIKLFLPHLLI